MPAYVISVAAVTVVAVVVVVDFRSTVRVAVDLTNIVTAARAVEAAIEPLIRSAVTNNNRVIHISPPTMRREEVVRFFDAVVNAILQNADIKLRMAMIKAVATDEQARPLFTQVAADMTAAPAGAVLRHGFLRINQVSSFNTCSGGPVTIRGSR